MSSGPWNADYTRPYRSSQPGKRLRKVFARQNGRCHRCGKFFKKVRRSPGGLTRGRDAWKLHGFAIEFSNHECTDIRLVCHNPCEPEKKAFEPKTITRKRARANASAAAEGASPHPDPSKVARPDSTDLGPGGSRSQSARIGLSQPDSPD